MQLLSIPQLCQELGMGKSWLYLVAVNAANLKLTLSDPNDYLSLATAGDPVSVTAPYRNDL